MPRQSARLFARILPWCVGPRGRPAGHGDRRRGDEDRPSRTLWPATLGALVTSYADRADPTPLRQIDKHQPTSAARVRAPDKVPELSVQPDSEEPSLPAEPEISTPIVAETAISTGSRFRDLLLAWYEADGHGGDDQAWLDEVSQRCRNALLRYGMSAKLEQSILTPNAALLKFKGSDDLTVSKVEAKATELETTHGIELFSVRAEPGRVSLSVHRPSRRLLSLPEVWKDWRGSGDIANARLLIAVQEDDGQPLFLEPEPAPHTLVAGSTGSGKSVLVQNIILGIAATNRPDQAKIILIDPKAGSTISRSIDCRILMTRSSTIRMLRSNA